MILADMVGIVYRFGMENRSDSSRKRQRSWKAPVVVVEDTKQSTDAKSRVSARTNVCLAGGVFFLCHTNVSCTRVLPPCLFMERDIDKIRCRGCLSHITVLGSCSIDR